MMIIIIIKMIIITINNTRIDTKKKINSIPAETKTTPNRSSG